MSNQTENVHKPILVLMAGLSGTGKTTLAYALGQAFQWSVIDKGMYKEILLKQGLDNDDASHAAYEISFATIHAALTKQKVSVIFDTAAFQHFILERVTEIVCCAGAQLKVILCVAGRDLRNHPLRARPNQPTTIRVDPATIADYLYYFRHLPSDKLILYTGLAQDECLLKARDYIMS